MNPFNLKDNALFLSCWHERNRPIQLICYTIFIAGLLLLSFLSFSLYDRTPGIVWHSLFNVLTTLQAVVLLLIGTLMVSSLSGRERAFETLDFHRNSPQPVLEKVIGLVFGAVWFEWLIFALLFVVELPFALLPKITLADILLFNTSLILTGIFFHTSAAVLTLMSPSKKRVSPIGLLFLLLFFIWPLIGLMFSSSQSNFFAHLFGATAMNYIYHEPSLKFNGWFYTLNLPLLVLQALVQIPLILLIVKGMKRIFSLPNSPVWSKLDVLRFCGFIFFMVTGFFVAVHNHFNEVFGENFYDRYHYHNNTSLESFTLQSMGVFIILFAAIGLFVGFITVPSYFKRTKYLILKTKKSIFDDGSSSLPTLLIYLAIESVFMIPYIFLQKISTLTSLAALVMLSSHILAFTGFLEYFRLSRFRTNKIFFVTALIVWWLFLPWLVSLVCDNKFEAVVNVGTLSPFVGIAYVFGTLSEKELTFFPLFLPCISAVVTWALALQEHTTLKKNMTTS